MVQEGLPSLGVRLLLLPGLGPEAAARAYRELGAGPRDVAVLAYLDGVAEQHLEAAAALGGAEVLEASTPGGLLASLAARVGGAAELVVWAGTRPEAAVAALAGAAAAAAGLRSWLAFPGLGLLPMTPLRHLSRLSPLELRALRLVASGAGHLDAVAGALGVSSKTASNVAWQLRLKGLLEGTGSSWLRATPWGLAALGLLQA